MDPNPATLTPPPFTPEPPTGTGSGDHATAWESAQEPSPLTATSAPGSGERPAPVAFAPHFTQGQVVADRYRILDFVARGGMGEVYEALDLDLNERLALKVLSRELSQSDEALYRFKRELSLARKVTHPNVCRTYDFFQHSEATGERIACLSMELLQGETLSQRLAREGRMDPALVRNLSQQAAAGLEAAHAAGVVHRDLKPSNIMLVKGSSGETSLRAVVTDFGLAFSQENAEKGSQRFLGTPAYMSPEQVEYHPITTRSDIYSLGLVIFEMLTGRVAFQGSNAISAATRRLKEPPPAARLLVPDLDPFWDGVLAKCLALKLEDRFASASDLLQALEEDAPRLLPLPRRPKRLLRTALAASLLFGGGAFAAWATTRGTAPWSRALGFIHHRPTLAVLGFKNLGPEGVAWRSTALAEMLGTELGLDGKLRLIPGEDVARMKVELGIQEDGPLDRALLGRIRARLGVDLVVVGSYLDSGTTGTFRVDMRLLDARSGEVKGLLRQEGRDQDILAVVHGAGMNLRTRLGLPNDSPQQLEGLVAAYPKDPEGMRLYALGLEKLRRLEPKEAIPLLERALALDTSCALVHTALADAWSQLGYDLKAKEQAQTALACASGLAREDRLKVEGRHAAIHRSWEKAAEAYRALFGFFPDNVEYGLGLAAALREGNQAQEAGRTLVALGKGLPGGKGDARIHLEAAELALSTGDVPKAIAQASRCRDEATRSGAGLLAARAQVRLATFLGLSGEFEAANREAASAAATFQHHGDRRGQASALHAGMVLDEMIGAFAKGKAAAKALDRLGSSLGNRRLQGQAEYMQALFDIERGAATESLLHSSESTRIFEEIGERQLAFIPLVLQMRALLYQGKLSAAGQMAARCEEIYRQTRNDRHLSFLRDLQGFLALAAGKLPEAEAHLSAGVALARKFSLPEEMVVGFEGLTLLHTWKGNRVQASQAILDAETYLATKTFRPGVAAIKFSDGFRAMEAGDSLKAIASAQAAGELYRAMGQPDGEARVRVLRSRGLLAKGDLDGAVKALEGAKGQAHGTDSFDLRMEFALQSGRLAAAQRKAGESRKWLGQAEALATRTGHVPLLLQSQILQASLDPKDHSRHQRLKEKAARLGLSLL